MGTLSIKGTIGIRTLSGDVSGTRNVSGEITPGSGGRKEVVSNTTEAWNSMPSLKSVKDVIYVYTDHTIVSGRPIPAMKIGDGQAFLIDLPFISGGSEIAPEQIEFWNEKCSVMLDPNDPEHMIFYTDQR